MELEVAIPAGPAKLSGNLSVPSDPRGIVLFAHGSGSSRYSPRNLFVARQLHQTGMATLLFDLLTAAEEVTDLRSREHRFNISLLAGKQFRIRGPATRQGATCGCSRVRHPHARSYRRSCLERRSSRSERKNFATAAAHNGTPALATGTLCTASRGEKSNVSARPVA